MVVVWLNHAGLNRCQRQGAFSELAVRPAAERGKRREAGRDFDEFRDSVELQRELGIAGFAQGLKIRKQALELARRELAKVRRPAASSNSKQLMTFDEYLQLYERERCPQYIDKVWLKPAGRVGSRVPPVEQRVDVYFAGAHEPAQPTARADAIARHQAYLQRERERLARETVPEPPC